MGAVYEVIHLETDRRRALKVMHPHLFQSDEMRDRFKLEARIAARVDSEHIVEVFDAGVDEATQVPFMVMELLRGEELGVRLKRLKRLPPEEVVTYMQQAAWALDRTHAASIVHRDLKPANLFLTTREDGTPRIKILDFGVAKLLAEGATAAGVTQSLGTPLYMAPEQFRARKKLTHSADIYALTLMTYTLLVGEAYWAEESRATEEVIGLAMAVVQGPQEPAEQRAARSGVILPPGFDAWFAKGTAVNPTERFGTATEAVQALRAVGGPAGIGIGIGSSTIAIRPAMPSEADASYPEVSSTARLAPPLPLARMIGLGVGIGAVLLLAVGVGMRLAPSNSGAITEARPSVAVALQRPDVDDINPSVPSANASASAVVLPSANASAVAFVPMGLAAEDEQRKALEPKVYAGVATSDEIRMLKAICSHLGNRPCRDRASTELKRKLSESAP